MATQQERRHATRRRLLDAALTLFRDQGVGATNTEAILRAAGVSRGALYHHFESKDELVAAVYEEQAAASIERATRPKRVDRPALDWLLEGCLAWMDDASRPDVARILLEEGPAALGWDRCRQIEDRHGLARIRTALQFAVEAGEIHLESVDLLARMLSAALGEAAIALARAHDRAGVRAEAETALRGMVAGLKVST